MEVIHRPPAHPSRLGVFPGAFNPVTKAHLEVARRALDEIEEVLFVLPRVFPHKDYDRPGLPERLALLEQALRTEPRFGTAVSERGLFIDIARECRELYGPRVELEFLCGRDAAERIVNWDYGAPDACRRMLDEFALLVAPRGGAYHPPPALASRIHPLPMPPGFDLVSSTEVRRRIAAREPWEELVPEAVTEEVRRLYAPGAREEFREE